MDKYGYIKILQDEVQKLIYTINNTRYIFCSVQNGKQSLFITENNDCDLLGLLGYKRILDNGLEEYINDLIKNVCVHTISTLHVTEYKFPPQPYFDALINKIKHDWIENENLQNNTILK